MDFDIMPNRELSLHLLQSIHDIDIRLNELETAFGDVRIERRKKLLERGEALIKTRTQLVQSFLFINDKSNYNPESSNPFERMELDFDKIRQENISLAELWKKLEMCP
jgi:hypothetical protein